MSKDLEEITTFRTRLGTFKYLMVAFSPYNRPAS